MRLLTCILILTINTILAGGFQVNLQGQKATGMGHAATGLLSDASSLFFNPGSTIFLDTLNCFYLGSSFIVPRTVYLEPFPGTYTSETMLHIGTPFTLYTAFKIKPQHKFMLGLSINTPFGSRVQWPDDWKGQFLIREISLKTIFIQPTFSYKINEHLGLGAGPIYATGGFELKKGIPVQDTAYGYGSGALDGSANGFGFNIGIFFKVNKSFSIGIDYRSPVKVTVDGGSADFEVPASLAEYFPSTSFSTSITLPQVVNFGLGYRIDTLWRFAADVNYVGWSSYDTLSIDFTDNTDKLLDIHSPRMYHNAFIFRMGAERKFKNSIWLRLGAYYDMSPVDAGYLTPETPDTDKIGITTGATIKLGSKSFLDLSFLYIEGRQRTDTNIETQFGGTYKSRAFVPGFGLEFQF